MEEKVKKSLKASIYDGVFTAVMEGTTSPFITPFAIALNASVSLIAALTYVPQLVGAFIHLFAAEIVEIVKNRKKIIVVCTLLHAILWIPLLLIPYLSPEKKYLIVAYISLQTIFSELISPMWNSLMGDLVPKYERGRFFGKRNVVVGATSFIAALGAGLLLNYLSPKNLITGFTILFALAFISRITSTVFKSMIREPALAIPAPEKFTIFDFVKKMDKTNYGHFVIYISLFKMAVSIASPFFAVYMLRDLHFTYLMFTMMVSVELIASFIAMNFLGDILDRIGTKAVLYIAGLMTPLIPILWLFSVNFYFLLFVQMFAGISWAGFNLSASNFIFDAVKSENRIRCIAYFKFFESIAVFAGALMGGVLANNLPSWVFISSIPLVFLTSGILRIIISLALLPTLREARLIELGLGHSFFKKHLYIRPTQGIVYEVIGKYSKEEEKQKRLLLKPKKKIIQKNKSYNKNLLRFIGQNVFKKKEKHDITNMEDIEHIAEEIEKGKRF